MSEPFAGVDALRSSLQRIARCRRIDREFRMEQDPTPTDLTAVLLDVVALFESIGIDYALIGGLAAMVYGRARHTEDLDFVAAPGHEAQLAAHSDLMKQHHFDPACTWKLYHVSGVELDIWKDEHAGSIIERARTETLAGRSVRIADPHDLIAMKLRADRPQDDYDISQIIQHTAIDETQVRALVTAEQFGRFEAIRNRTRRSAT
jgi:hypothetical protein